MLLVTSIATAQTAPIPTAPHNVFPTTSKWVASFLKYNVVAKFLTNVPADRIHRLGFTMSTMDRNGVVTYTKGTNLIYDKNAGTLSGTGSQYFSDRISNGAGEGLKPFDPNKTDEISLTLNVNDGSVTITKSNTPIKLNSPDLDRDTNSIIGNYRTGPNNVVLITLQFLDYPRGPS